MKKLLLAIYIILVVSASLAARAEFVPPLKIQTAKFEYIEQTQTLVMKVVYPNACVRDARAVLSLSPYPNTLFVDVHATRIGDGCIRNVANIVNDEVEVTPIDARALKFELQRLGQDLEGTYTIMTRDGSFRQTIDFSALDAGVSAQNTEISGILLMPNSGNTQVQDINHFVF
jgi:hypothetical protein